MNNKELDQQAQQRQKLLETMYSPQELQKIQKFNPRLAQSFLLSAQLNASVIEEVKK